MKIKKEIVQEIIQKNNETKSYKNLADTEFVAIKDISLESLKWSDSRIALRDFIANLSTEELIDLIALMDYGREHYNMRDKSKNMVEFMEKRKNLNIKTIEEKKYKASYLLGKIYLSEYLQYSLQLFENEDFKF